mmetsp:Transcript_18572/g.25743  ORF Transcript_18572/g.25743 Transcript_18572/m.25743 type:complete len:134 (-) Transcript_18572:194-595(-)
MAPNFAMIAPRVGFVGNAVVAFLGVIGLLVGSIGVALWTVLVAIMIAPLEMPVVCVCAPDLGATMLEKMRMNNWFIRGAFYVLLTILMFLGSWATILAGVVLLLTGVIYIVAQAQGLREEPDEGNTGESAPII